MQETLIQNATIYDGTGCQPFHADVLIRGSIIADIGNIPPLPEYTVVDAQGLALSPGFINTHSHMELELLRDPSVHQVVDQGITTEVLGQDGVPMLITCRLLKTLILLPVLLVWWDTAPSA